MEKRVPEKPSMHEFAFEPVLFRDVDQFSEWERSLGWQIDSTQLSAGPNRMDFDHFAFPELLVGHFRSKQSMHNVFDVPDGTVVFLVCRAKRPLLFDGTEVPPSLLAFVLPGRDHWATLPSGLDCYEFMVSEALIRRTELLPEAMLSGKSRFEDAAVPLVEPQAGRFLDGLDAFFRRARSACGPIEDAVCSVDLYEFLLSGLHRVVDTGLAARGSLAPRAARRADLVPKARELVATRLGEELTADDVAQALGVSYRVLHYAFRDALGVSPYRFLLTEKLHSARRQLKTANTSVTDALLAHGFSTPARFAQQYKRLFGELPSQTLAATRARPAA